MKWYKPDTSLLTPSPSWRHCCWTKTTTTAKIWINDQRSKPLTVYVTQFPLVLPGWETGRNCSGKPKSPPKPRLHVWPPINPTSNTASLLQPDCMSPTNNQHPHAANTHSHNILCYCSTYQPVYTNSLVLQTVSHISADSTLKYADTVQADWSLRESQDGKDLWLKKMLKKIVGSWIAESLGFLCTLKSSHKYAHNSS